LGFRGSRVQGFMGSGVQGFRGSGVQGFMGSGVQGFRGSGVQGLRGSGAQGLNSRYAAFKRCYAAFKDLTAFDLQSQICGFQWVNSFLNTVKPWLNAEK
jgi:hypothetical protein